MGDNAFENMTADLLAIDARVERRNSIHQQSMRPGNESLHLKAFGAQDTDRVFAIILASQTMCCFTKWIGPVLTNT
jgi:hypothetical protein